MKKLLVLGIYLANHPNHVTHIVSVLSNTISYQVTQRWVALGGPPASQSVAGVTVRTLLKKTPKFQILNDLLGKEDLAEYEYVLIMDDDIVLPDQFLDRFIALQTDLNFALAQPARTGNSYLDHPIVEQQWGVAARQTLFVEIGPVVSVHRSAYELIFPFDLTSPMGWGYNNVWPCLLAKHDLKMGILDLLAVEHSLRKPAANYSWEQAARDRALFLEKNPHLPLEQCFRVLDVIYLEEGELRSQMLDVTTTPPRISVIIPTYDRHRLLSSALESLVHQSIPKHQYEVIVVDDGSADRTPEICKRFSADLSMKYLRLNHSGLSAAKNLGLFASTGSIVLFFDDDGIADKDFLQQHIKAHEEHTHENIAVLGYSTWAPSPQPTSVMQHLYDTRGCIYDALKDAQIIDSTCLHVGCWSCKRSFLVRHGGFKQQLESGLEDFELGRRLSRFDLKVMFC